MRKVVRQMGADGWLGVGWPKEYGGRGFTPVEQFIWFDESMRAGAPVPMLTINTVGPTIMRFGSDEQKEFFLPKILRGEIHFCIGYSEPGAGTDLAALRTRADRDGDEYMINGQKMWTSLASDADYIWLAVRTNQEAKKHKGISLFVIPMDTPGIKVVPIHVMGESNINQTYFEDVRVPASMRVGEENAGWQIITNQLNHERVTLCSSGIVERSLNDVREWAQRHEAGRRSPCHRPGVGAAQPRARARAARVPAAHQLEDRVGEHEGLAAPCRRVVDQGVRHRVLSRGLPSADGDHGRACVPRRRRSRVSSSPAGSSTSTAASSSSRSVAAPTRSSATSSRCSVSACPSPLARRGANMDFDFSDEQQEFQNLAKQIFEGELSTERQKEIDAGGDRFDRELWATLAKAGLLGVAVPEEQGGLGYGFLEACIVLEQVGRTVAPVPYLASVVFGALPIAQFGTDAQKNELAAGRGRGRKAC